MVAKNAGIASGQSVSGFAVRFTRLGAGNPGNQNFEIYGPDTLALLGTGTTSTVPMPATIWLLGTALIGAGMATTRRRRA